MDRIKKKKKKKKNSKWKFTIKKKGTKIDSTALFDIDKNGGLYVVG